MYEDMQWWEEIRNRVLLHGVSQREILRETKIHWTTLKKILAHPEPPEYARDSERPKPKLGPYLARIQQILLEDRDAPRKQRHTAKRIFDRLREEGYTGSYTQVRVAVKDIRGKLGEVFIPLAHRPGEAQVDVGHAEIRQGGEQRKIIFLVMCLPHSDAFFVQAYERACTESFWEFHKRAFEYFGGVPHRITYDNDKVLVSKVIGPGKRKLTHGFLQLKSHYVFDVHFCNVRRPNEKGVVEVLVQFARRNFMVPVPEVRDLDQLNERLVIQCREDLKRTLRGKPGPKAMLLKEDQEAFGKILHGPFDACRKASTTVSSLSLVRFDNNDYSVPVCHAHRTAVVKGYIDRVVVCRGDQAIARHVRLWGQGDVSLEPIHYLALLERKPGALDHGRPFVNWELPGCFAVLRARLENDLSGEGTREYIRVLRLLEKHSLAEVTRAIEQGLRCGALIRDAIAQFLIPREDWGMTTFRLDGREYLRHVKVGKVEVASYADLLPGGGGS